MTDSAQKPVEALSFEEALEELENLTAKLASGTVTLRESVAAYERGAALLERCEGELAAARGRIEALRAKNAQKTEEKTAGRALLSASDIPF